MTDWELKIMEIELEELAKQKEIAKYHMQHDLNHKETDEFGFEVVKSGSGKAVIMPNGIRLSKTKCIPYKSITLKENGILSAGKTDLPLTLTEIIKFKESLDEFPKSGSKDRAVWCENHFNKQFTYEVIIYNLFIGTFDSMIKEPILIIGE